MQFLHEEFFGKIYKTIKNINIAPIRIIAKLIFWVLGLGILGFLAWIYVTGKQKLFFWIISIIFAAEIAHMIRKSRERAMSINAEESSNISEQLLRAGLIKKEEKKIRRE